MCAEQIPLEATVCEFCGAKFEVSAKDGQTESRFIEESPGHVASPQAIAPQAVKRNSFPWLAVRLLALLIIGSIIGVSFLRSRRTSFSAQPAPPTAVLTSNPTQAVPTRTSRPSPIPASTVEVSVYCGYFSESPVYLDAGQRVILYWKWGAATEEYRRDYIDVASFALQLDGAFLDLSTAAQSLHSCEEGGLCVTWRLQPINLEAGKHEVIMTVSLAREITDGFDLDQNGALDTYGPGDWTAPPCEIILS